MPISKKQIDTMWQRLPPDTIDLVTLYRRQLEGGFDGGTTCKAWIRPSPAEFDYIPGDSLVREQRIIHFWVSLLGEVAPRQDDVVYTAQDGKRWTVKKVNMKFFDRTFECFCIRER